MKGEKSSRLLVFVMVAIGVFLSTMDSSMINVALPSIMRAFGTTLVAAELVIVVYLLTITVLLVVCGYLADHVGQLRVYLLGMLIFSIGSFLCFISPSLVLLVLSRFVQATGAAMMMATGPAIIRIHFPHKHLGQSLGLLGIATSMGLMSGPVVSGLLVEYVNWRAIFLVTVPLSLAALVMGWKAVANDIQAIPLSDEGCFDWLGSLLWAAGVGLFVITLYYLERTDVLEKCFCILAIILAAIFFYRVEKQHPNPILPLTFFKKQNFSTAVTTASISFVVLFIVLILIPFYMEYVLGSSPGTIGYVMMAVPVTLFVLSPASGWLYDKIGATFLTVSGLLISCTAVILLSSMEPSVRPFDVAWRLALLGAGQSIFVSPNTASVLSAIGKEHTGIASGIMATSRNIGMLIGVALAGTIFSSLFSSFSGGIDLKEYSSNNLESFLRAFSYTLRMGAFLAYLGGIISMWRGTADPIGE
jgi:EmrB/QacA subfamily drug resistance transporter